MSFISLLRALLVDYAAGSVITELMIEFESSWPAVKEAAAVG